MHLRDLEAGSQGALGGAYEGLHQRLDLRLAQGLGGSCAGDRTGSPTAPPGIQPPSPIGTLPCLPSHGRQVLALRPAGQLNPGDRALGLDETGDAMQRLDMRVAPDAEVVGGDAPSGNTAVASTITSAGAAHRAAAQVHEMPVVGQALLRRILAHGRYGDAVGQGDLTQAKRLEQQTHGRTPGRSWNKCSPRTLDRVRGGQRPGDKAAVLLAEDG